MIDIQLQNNAQFTRLTDAIVNTTSVAVVSNTTDKSEIDQLKNDIKVLETSVNSLQAHINTGFEAIMKKLNNK